MRLMVTAIALFKCELTKIDFIEKGGKNGCNRASKSSKKMVLFCKGNIAYPTEVFAYSIML